MPPARLIDLSAHDLGAVCINKTEIYKRLPQRFEFQVLDGFIHASAESRTAVAFAEINPDAWWVRGHVEGRALLPGVLMLEMAAQASAILSGLVTGSNRFLGFGGVDQCKFRGAVTPPARLYLLVKDVEDRPRRVVSVTQGICDDKLVFEARITGMAM